MSARNSAPGGLFDDVRHPALSARASDPETSKLAASRVAEFREDHHDIIHAALRSRVDGVRVMGMTVHEIAAQTRLTAHEVGKRMSEMEGKRAAVVRDEALKELTKLGPTGRPCRLWRPLGD